MQKDERDLLEVLKFELKFLEDGRYGHWPRAPWRPQYIFEDSLTCMNYDSKENPGPCSDCDSLWNRRDRKSTRLNSSHSQISYAVFCLKKKKFKLTVSRRPIQPRCS